MARLLRPVALLLKEAIAGAPLGFFEPRGRASGPTNSSDVGYDYCGSRCDHAHRIGKRDLHIHRKSFRPDNRQNSPALSYDSTEPTFFYVAVAISMGTLAIIVTPLVADTGLHSPLMVALAQPSGPGGTTTAYFSGLSKKSHTRAIDGWFRMKRHLAR